MRIPRRIHAIGWAALNALQAVALCLWSAFWISAALLVLAVTRRPELPLVMARRYWAPLLVRGSVSRLRVEGLENVDWRRPHVVMMNHESFLDVPVAFYVIPAPLRFVAKESLRGVPFLGWFIRATGMVTVDAGRGVQSVRRLRQAAEVPRAGGTLLVFPQGERSNGPEIVFRRAPFMLAQRAGVPVVPASIRGAGDVLPRGGFRLRRGNVDVRFGAPIPSQGMPVDELRRRVLSAVIALREGETAAAPASSLGRAAAGVPRPGVTLAEAAPSEER